VSPAAQWVSSHELPTPASPTSTQLVVPSSFTTAQVWLVGHVPKRAQPLMGMHTGTLNFPETTGCTSQNDGLAVASHTVLPAQQ
jgi:tellurite resistance protein TehA-like permease